MRLVAGQRTLQHVADNGGDLYVWPRSVGCCRGRSYRLEAATRPPDKPFHRVHEEGRISVWATPGLAEPDSIEVELGRRGQLRAYWNGQAWIG